ncbi:MAG: L-histidine N(alpha)-methyltransferase [Desulfobacteraceae bacterium]|nr:L-histidine N(alpha)-methyltransferase [Desulfobacteraceae bacterium]
MPMTADCTREELLRDFRQAQAGGGSRLVRMPRRAGGAMEFARSVAAGLRRRPRRLDCRFLYDARGSELYERICGQPEYYPTRTEAAILAAFATDICRATGPVTLLELGSGSSAKTGHLLGAYARAYGPLHYVPVDVSESALRQAGHAIGGRYPEVRVTGINSTYEEAFHFVPTVSPALVLFLGSTVGNLDEEEADGFWQAVSGRMQAGDYFLLGIDLVKDPAVIEAAYDDEAGVTAAFTRNLFARMNRELGAALDPDAIEHVARYRPERERIEIHARFTRPQRIEIAPLGESFAVGCGEEILVEISRKFRLPALPAYFRGHGFQVRETYTDERGWFALLLLRKV